MTDERGFLIPYEFSEVLLRPVPEWMTGPREPVKWTWRMRYRLWRADLRERIHDWLFPDFRRSDWDD